MKTSYFLMAAILHIHEGRCDSLSLVYEMTLTEAFKHDLVFYHNLKRSTVSPTSGNMIMLHWDNELAKEASKFVRKCSFKHSNPPLQSAMYGQLGENLYAGDEFRFSAIPFGVVNAWYNEVPFYDIYKNPTCLPGKECGHYTQLVWADTTHIGCAISVCNQIQHGSGRTLVACMYGPAGNQFTSDLTQLPPYKVGVPCSSCPSDHFWCVAGLCF